MVRRDGRNRRHSLHPTSLSVLKMTVHRGRDLLTCSSVWGAAPEGTPESTGIDEVWTWANFLGFATKLHAAGHAFANPIGPTGDSQNWIPPLFSDHTLASY